MAPAAARSAPTTGSVDDAVVDTGAKEKETCPADANSATPKARVEVNGLKQSSTDEQLSAAERLQAARKAAEERQRRQRAAKAACAKPKKKNKRKSAKTANAERLRSADGTPQQGNPTLSLATPGAAPIGVPNFFIDKFRIPPFLLPIYQAAGIEYGIRWEVLAAINEIETDYGRNLNVSSAGALGWMQFMPATWDMYGVDANHDGDKDPYNPVDAIFAAARYLRAAGADTDLNKAIFAYNHADWYVDSVLMRAQLIGGLPANLVGSLTGLTQAHFPVYAKARYADDLSEARATRRAKRGENAAYLVNAAKNRRGVKIYARAGAPVIAVNDGKIVRIGVTERLGRFIQLQDAYGNTFTYGHLKKIPALYPARKQHKVTQEEIARELELPAKDAAPTAPASATTQHGPPPPPPPRRPRRRRPPRPRLPPRRPSSRRRAAPAWSPNGGCSPIRHGRGLWPPAVSGSCPARAMTPSAASQASRSTPGTWSPSRCARGLASRPARSSAVSAGRRRRPRRTCCSRSAPPAAAPRGSTRSRSSTAGSCSSRPRSTAPRAATPSTATTPRPRRSARSC